MKIQSVEDDVLRNHEKTPLKTYLNDVLINSTPSNYLKNASQHIENLSLNSSLDQTLVDNNEALNKSTKTFPPTKVGKMAEEISIRSARNKSPEKTPYKAQKIQHSPKPILHSPKRSKRPPTVFTEYPDGLSMDQIREYAYGTPNKRKIKK